MLRIRVKGIAAFRSTPAEYMWDMLRYDDGKIEAIYCTPELSRLCEGGVPFRAIVQLKGYTPDRWRSFGLYPDVLGAYDDADPSQYPGYTVDEWKAHPPLPHLRYWSDFLCVGHDHSPVQD